MYISAVRNPQRAYVEHGDGGLLALPVERLVERLRDRSGEGLLMLLADAVRVSGAGIDVCVSERNGLIGGSERSAGVTEVRLGDLERLGVGDHRPDFL